MGCRRAQNSCFNAILDHCLELHRIEQIARDPCEHVIAICEEREEAQLLASQKAGSLISSMNVDSHPVYGVATCMS